MDCQQMYGWARCLCTWGILSCLCVSSASLTEMRLPWGSFGLPTGGVGWEGPWSTPKEQCIQIIFPLMMLLAILVFMYIWSDVLKFFHQPSQMDDAIDLHELVSYKAEEAPQDISISHILSHLMAQQKHLMSVWTYLSFSLPSPCPWSLGILIYICYS